MLRKNKNKYIIKKIRKIEKQSDEKKDIFLFDKFAKIEEFIPEEHLNFSKEDIEFIEEVEICYNYNNVDKKYEKFIQDRLKDITGNIYTKLVFCPEDLNIDQYQSNPLVCSFYSNFNMLLCDNKDEFFKKSNTDNFLIYPKLFKHLSTVFDKNSIYSWDTIKENMKDELKYEFFIFDKYPMEHHITGISISKILCEAKWDLENNKLLFDIRIDSEFAYVPRAGKQCFKFSGSGFSAQHLDCEEFFQLNGKFGIHNHDILFFNEHNSLYTFFSDVEPFIKEIGFYNVLLNRMKHRDSFEARYFLNFLFLSAKYPNMNAVVKTKGSKMIGHIITNFMSYYISNAMAYALFMDLDFLFGNEFSKQKPALEIPNYILDYLFDHNLDYKDYLFWVNVCALTTPISEFDFLDIINSIGSIVVLHQISSDQVNSSFVLNTIKYGYHIKEYLDYIYLQSKQNNVSIWNSVFNLHMYLNMCNDMSLKIDFYPDNLKNTYEQVLKEFEIFQEKQSLQKNEFALLYKSKANQKTLFVLNAIENSTDPIIKEISDHYTFVIPKNSEELNSESFIQHDNTYSYHRSMIEEKTVLFFIRNKKCKIKPYVTAVYDSSAGSDNRNCINITYKNGSSALNNKKIKIFADFIFEQMKLSQIEGREKNEK